jgi:transcriptional regulator with XRE-family HTH domain
MSVLFEERLREAMGKAKINQSELAALAGVSKASISQYLSGKNEPKHQVIEKFAEVLGVDEAWLDGHSDEPLVIKPRILRPHQAAKIIGSNPSSVRIRMQKERFNPSIGTACKLNGDRYSYEIFPERLAAYLNITVDAVYQRLNA